MEFSIGNQTFNLDDVGSDTLPRQAMLVAVDAANSFAAAKHAVMNDGHLSAAGKNAKLAPLADAVWRQVFVSLENINNERLHCDAREAKLYAIAQISTPYEISMDRERRDWFRCLPRGDQTRVVDAMKAGADHSELVSSLLRSPVPLGLDSMLRLVEEIHHLNCRAANPDEWDWITGSRQATDQAWRGMQHVVGISHGLTERPASVVLRLALATGHEQAARLMSDAATVSEIRRLMVAAENLRRAA